MRFFTVFPYFLWSEIKAWFLGHTLVYLKITKDDCAYYTCVAINPHLTNPDHAVREVAKDMVPGSTGEEISMLEFLKRYRWPLP